MIKLSKTLLIFSVSIIFLIMSCDFSLSLRIQGKVTDTEGLPIENADVELWWSLLGDRRNTLEAGVKTNEKGEYDLRFHYKDEENCPADQDNWVLHVGKIGYLPVFKNSGGLGVDDTPFIRCTEEAQQFNFALTRADSIGQNSYE